MFGLDTKSQAKITASIDKLALFGPNLGRPDVDSLEGSRHANMKELRVRHAGHQYRILFAFDPQRLGLLIIGADKKGANQKRFYKQLISSADRLYDEHLKTKRNKSC